MTDTTDSPTPVEDLLARARAYVTHSHAKNTLDAYAADGKHFSAWCVDVSEYSGHSLRAGLVTAAAMAGVNERVIMQQTGHKNTATLRRYIREGSLFRENAAAAVGL
jgi:integrase